MEGSVGSGTWAAKPVEPAGAGASVASAASVEPELRRVTALRTRKRVPTTGAELGADGTRGGARRSWSSAWNEATDTTRR